MEPIDPAIAGMLTYRPRAYRPVVNIPGRKPYACARVYDNYEDAYRWAQGFINGPGSFIKPGSSVTIGDAVLAVLELSNGARRLQSLGARRMLGAVKKESA